MAHHGRRRPIRTAAQLLAFAFVVQVFVIPQIGGARKALDTVSEMSPALIALAFVLEAFSVMAYGALTRVLLSEEHRIDVVTCTGIAVAAMGVNHVVPGGAATTAAVNYRLFALAGVDGPELAYTLVTQAVGSALVLNAILWLALVVSIPANGFHLAYGVAAAVGALLMTLAAVAVAGLLEGRAVLARALVRGVAKVVRADAAKLDGAVSSAAEHLRSLLTDRRRLRSATALAAGNWLLDAAALFICLWAFGSRPSAVGVLVAYGLANVMAAIPISPGGLGIVEAVLIPTLVGFGTPASVAAVGVVAYRLLQFWLPIPTGALAYVLVERHLSAKRPGGVRPVIDDLLSGRGEPPPV